MPKVVTFVIVCVGLFFSSCSQQKIEVQLKKTDSLLQSNPVKADSVLMAIDTNSIGTESSHAYYNLLKCQLDYLFYRHVSISDLDYSIGYYIKHHNKRMLSRCYLYRAYVNERNHGSFKHTLKDFYRAKHNLEQRDNVLSSQYARYCRVSDSFAVQNQYDSAYVYQKYADSIKYRMKEIQLLKVQVIEENKHEEKERTQLNWILAILILAIGSFDLTIILIKRNKAHKKLIQSLLLDFETLKSDLDAKILSSSEPLKNKITSLKKLLFQHQHTINDLNKKISKSNSEISANLKKYADVAEGVKWLYYVLNDESDLEFNKAQIKQLIDCYQLLDQGFVLSLEQVCLTPKEKIFCILHRLNKEPQQIILTLDMSKDSYRQLKSRTLKKLRNGGVLPQFCDIISGNKEK